MASGHVNRTQRPNTWLHRPSLQREDSPCQLGAVHTWPTALLSATQRYVCDWGLSGNRADTSDVQQLTPKATFRHPVLLPWIDLSWRSLASEDVILVILFAPCFPSIS
jgi:hypothetical protein